MKHITFETIDSTQTYLKQIIEDILKESDEVLVSTLSQTKGIGRTGNSWISFEQSLAFSFTLSPQKEEFSLTTIEIAISTLEFFKKKYSIDILLKWPNDLYLSNQRKVGGIITNYYNEKILIVGIGINLNFSDENFGHLNIPSKFDCHLLSKEIYEYILLNRLNANEIIQKFHQYTNHLNKLVSIDSESGIFIGINNKGEALIKTNNGIKEFNSGSLLMNGI
jgi:BirA family biotin operon repressor/biotin-[acetyl-CoA-carboxylase] ligase